MFLINTVIIIISIIINIIFNVVIVIIIINIVMIIIYTLFSNHNNQKVKNYFTFRNESDILNFLL